MVQRDERPQSTINPQAFALQAGLNSVPKKKAPVVSSQAPMQSSLQPQPMQSQAPTVATPKPVVTPKIGGIAPTFGATNINAQPTLGGATPQELGKQQQIINSQPNLPQELPETGVDKTVPQKVDYIQSIKDLKETLNTSDSLDDIRGVFPEFSKLDDSALADLIATTRDNEDLDDILGVFPELNKSAGEGNILTDNFITDLGSGIGQSVSNYGKLGKKLGIKAGNALRPVFGKEKYSKDELASMYDNSDTAADQITNRQTPEQKKTTAGAIGETVGTVGQALVMPTGVSSLEKIPAIAKAVQKAPVISSMIKGGLQGIVGQEQYNLATEGRMSSGKELATAGVIGAAIPGLGAAAKKIVKSVPKVKQFATRDFPISRIEKELALTPTARETVERTGITPGEYILKKNLGGVAPEKQVNELSKISDEAYNGQTEALKGIQTKVQSEDAKKMLTTMTEEMESSSILKREYGPYIDKLKELQAQGDYTPVELLAIKRDFDRIIGHQLFNAKGRVSGVEDKAIANRRNNLADQIEEVGAGNGIDIREMNNDVRNSITIREGILRSLSQKNKNNLFGLQDIGVGAILSAGNPVAGTAVVIGKKALEKAIPGVSQSLYNLNKTPNVPRNLNRGVTISTRDTTNGLSITPSARNSSISPGVTNALPLKEGATVFPGSKGQIGSSKPIPKSNQTTREIGAIGKPYPNSTVPVKASEEVLSKPKTKVPVKESNPLLAEAKKYKSAEDFVEGISENLAKKNIMTFDEFQKTKPSTTIEMYNKIKKEMPFMLEKEGEFIKGVNQAQLDKMVNPGSNGRHYQLKQIREEANGKTKVKPKK